VRWAGGLLLNAALGCLLFLPLVFIGLAVLLELHVLQDPTWKQPLSLVLVMCVPMASLIVTAAVLANRRLSQGLPADRLYWILTTILLAAPASILLVPSFARVFH
jgi:hypothetical protein